MYRAAPEGFVGDSIDNVHPALRKCFHPVCRSADLLDDAIVPVRLLGTDWAVARIGGRLVAMVDQCPHRFAPLSAGDVVDGTVQCAYHGYRYGLDGRCVHVPALGAGLVDPAQGRRADGVRGRGTLRADLDGARGAGDRHHRRAGVGRSGLPRRRPSGPGWPAGAGQMTENFLDMGHLAFLHAKTFGDPEGFEVPNYTVERDGWGFVCDLHHSAKLLADSTGAERVPGQRPPLDVVVRGTFALRLRIEYYVDDVVLTILFFHQPVDASTTKLYCFDLRNDIADGRTTVEEAVAFQLAVAAEDRAMLEKLRTTATPLDLNAEVHTRADRNTVEMRKVLADLVATSG